MGLILVYLFVVTTGIAYTAAIATIHHDKPESVTISTTKISTAASVKSSTPLALTNLTLSLSERKKRLLPYQNFYFDQPFNRPHQAGVSAQQYNDFQDVARPSKKPNVEPVVFRPGDTLYQSGQKFTPFLETNALPGPFRPMSNPNHPGSQKIQYVFVHRPQAQEVDKEVSPNSQPTPDLSAIYEKLAQLKLRQQVNHHNTPYGYRLVPQHRFRERPQKLQEVRLNYEAPRYNIQPSKTTIETFTATNIDIPVRNIEEQYEQPEPPRYDQIPTTTNDELQVPVRTKYREYSKPFIHHQIAIEVPQSSLPLTFNPGVVRKPGNNPNERPRTYILIQQGKPNPKQPPFILRKSKPTTVVDENYIAEKFVPVVHPKTHNYQPHRPIYIPQEPPYQVYENNFEATKYQATPIPSVTFQHQFLSADNPNYEQPDFSEKPASLQEEKVVADTPTPSVQFDNDDHQKYYQYQAVTPSPATPAPELAYNPVRVTEKTLPQYQDQEKYDEGQYQVTPKLENSKSSSLADVLKQLQDNNALPQTLTPDNIDNSIKTLVKILNALKDRQKQHKPIIVHDDYEYENEAGVDLGGDAFDTPDGGTPGKPGVDYPALSSIPKTTFSCKTQRYKGFFGDPDTNCQVWHYCDLNGGQASFLCPNGTIFSQVALTCDWWYNVKCSSTAQLYVLNERLYKYIIPLSPKFPEDYSGPLVDKYLAMKFQEMEEKLKKQKKGKGNSDSNENEGSTENEESEEEEEEDSDSSKGESQVQEEAETPTTDTSNNIEETTLSNKT